jgi:hypothetical protein
MIFLFRMLILGAILIPVSFSQLLDSPTYGMSREQMCFNINLIIRKFTESKITKNSNKYTLNILKIFVTDL